jgi:sensor c-di-GMP phosphodiesterase-like protein
MKLFPTARRHWPDLALMLCGTILGISLAHSIASSIRLRDGRQNLQGYARRLVLIGDQFGRENTDAITAVTHDNLPFCSDQELAFMRDYVFRSPHIRDLGRTRDGVLYCTTGLGRLPEPKGAEVPDISANGLNIYVDIPVVISSHTRGFVVEKSGVSLVLNPAEIQKFEEPPMYYSGFLFDRFHNNLKQTYGPPVPLSKDEITAGNLIERGGIIYQPLCSQTSMVCQVAAVSRSTLLAQKGSLFPGFLIVGALLGIALSIILILLEQRQRSVERQLRRAVRRGELTIAYQPVVRLDTGAIVGAEALARWVNEAGEAIRPDIFVALAEEKGFVREITHLILRKAIEEMGDLLTAGDFELTLNITAEDLSDAHFFILLEQSMQLAKLEPSTIGFELTERSTADQTIAIDAIGKLRRAGHKVYIDDFGTGYSSLSYLHRLSADAIKIDRGFTQTVGTGAVTASVVPLILNMAGELGLTVVVEGIETSEQAEFFRKAGAGILGQGWLFGKPVTAAQFKKLIREKAA